MIKPYQYRKELANPSDIAEEKNEQLQIDIGKHLLIKLKFKTKVDRLTKQLKIAREDYEQVLEDETSINKRWNTVKQFIHYDCECGIRFKPATYTQVSCNICTVNQLIGDS